MICACSRTRTLPRWVPVNANGVSAVAGVTNYFHISPRTKLIFETKTAVHQTCAFWYVDARPVIYDYPLSLQVLE